MASKKIPKLREEAQKLFGKGKWDKALKAYSQLTKIDSGEPKHFQKVAELQLKLDMKQAAIDTYKKTCDQFMAKGFLIQAIAICKIVIQLAPEEKDMEDKLSELYAKRGMPSTQAAGKRPAPARPKPPPTRPKPAATPPRKPAPAPKPAPQPRPAESVIALDAPDDSEDEMILEDTAHVDTGADVDAGGGISLEPASGGGIDLDSNIGLDLDGSDDDMPVPISDDGIGIDLDLDGDDDGGVDLDLGDEIEMDTALAADDGAVEIDPGDEPEIEEPSVDVGMDAADEEDDGIEIDVMGDLDDDIEEKEDIEDIEEDVAEEEDAGPAVFDLSAEMDTEEDLKDFSDEWDDDEVAEEPEAIEELEVIEEAQEEITEMPPSGNLLLNEEDIEDGMFFPEIPLFSDLAEDEFREVIRHLRAHSFSKGDTLIKEGDPGDSIFIVASGSVTVYKDVEKKGKKSKVLLATLSEGEFFGEFGYFAGSKRHASVQAVEDADLLEITHEDMEKVVANFPGVEAVLEKFYRTRVVENLLATSPLFLELEAKQRSQVASLFRLEEFREGTDIVVEGEEGEKMYLIRSGHVDVKTTNPMGEKIKLAELGPGDFFGEIAIISGKMRTATVSALTPMVELMSLNKEDMDDLMEQFPAIGEKINETIEARTEDTINKVSFLDLDEDDLEIGSLL